jgi:hypothetical protein
MNLKPRDREFNIIVAETGFGKSTLTARIIEKSRDKHALIYKEPNNIDDPAHLKFPLINFKEYRGGKVRICSEDIAYPEFIDAVYRRFRGGILVLDDAALYGKKVLDDRLKDLIGMKRHNKVDIFNLYYNLAKVPNDAFRSAKNLILGGCIKPLIKETKLDLPDFVLEAQDRIRRKIAGGDKYYKEWIRLMN